MRLAIPSSCGLLLFLSALSAQAATFGRIVPLVGGATDIVLDEARGRIYLTSSLQNSLQVYSIQGQFVAKIPTDATPLSAALSRDRKYVYVTCYDASVLDVIDLDALALSASVALPSKPEGVSVGKDGRVLISTTGSGTSGASNVLLLYDPTPNAQVVLTNLPVAPAPPAPPTLPPQPPGRPFLATHSQLAATRDGSTIVGINAAATGSPVVFVYESASNTVLRSRLVAGTSTVISISDDGTRFLCGPDLFDTATLQVLAQENAANAPFPIVFTGTNNFNVQSSQGGGAFAPDGQTLYAAFDVSPIQTPPAAPNVSQLMLNDPDNLLIRMGLELPENLAGKMVISSDGATIYALSDSGFTILAVGTIARSPLAVPSTNAVLLTRDPCAVTAVTSSATVGINNPSGGRVTATAQLLQIAGQANQSAPATAPTVRTSQAGNAPQFAFAYNPAAARGLGTVTPPHDFLIQSPEAINIPYRVRVYQNSRDSEARGAVIPIPLAAAAEPFPDLLWDQPRQRLYIANPGLNRVDVYDIRQQTFLAPVKVGQLPVSMALTPDGNTLYVANSGGETISIVDPDKMQTVGRVNFPPLPFNSNLALMTPRVIAAGLGGPQILMSNTATTATLWKVVGNTAVPRPASRLLGQSAQGVQTPIPLPSSMATTPGGEYIMLATSTGLAYLYDASVDDFVASRQVVAAPTGYIGPVAAGPRGQFFAVGGTVLNQALVPVGAGASGRLVSAVAPMGNTNVVIFTPPAAVAGNALPATPPAIQIMDAATGAPTLQVNALEATIITASGATRPVIGGRTMAVDPAGATAYVITASGLSIIPLTAVSAADRPQPAARGAVNLASYQLPVAANGLLSIFGQNLASSDAASSSPLPLVLGGACVTLNNIALPLYATSPTQINAQIPPDLAPGTYPLVVRSIARQAAAPSQSLAVSKYGPAVVVDGNGQAALFHSNGTPVNKDFPTTRDERLTLYALGLGPTTGGTVTAGAPSPSNPLAVTGPVEVFFGDPTYKQAAIVVEWSGLAPGYAGLYQINLYVPGFHMNGDALPITLRVGGVSSPVTGPVLPVVAIN